MFVFREKKKMLIKNNYTYITQQKLTNRLHQSLIYVCVRVLRNKKHEKLFLKNVLVNEWITKIYIPLQLLFILLI